MPNRKKQPITKQPDFRVMTTYTTPNGKTAFREIGALWSFATDKAVGMNGHINQDVKEGTEIVLFHTTGA